MFIRNNSSTAQEIAKAFIRNSSGVAEEISKIYIRDASGNAVLVFDSTPVVILDCPNCTGDTVSVYYFTLSEKRFVHFAPVSFSTATIGGCSSSNTSLSWLLASETINTNLVSLVPGDTRGTEFPIFAIDKNYWKKISVSYNEAKIANNGIEDISNQFYSTLTQTLNVEPCPALGYSDHTGSPWNSDGGAQFTGVGLIGLCFPEYYSSQPTSASNLDANTVYSLRESTFIGSLATKLKASFDFVTNYPIIPGYIVIDYLSENSKSTIFAFHKKPSYLFTSHGKNIRNPDDNSTLERLDIGRAIAHGFYDQDSTTVGIRDGVNNLPNRKTSIYPFYDKVICFEFPGDSSLDDLQIDDGGGTHCGQEYCAGIYGLHKFRTWFNVGSLTGPAPNVYAPCLNWAYEPIVALLKNSGRSLNTAKAWLQNSTSFNFFYQGSVGKKFCNLGASTWPGTFRQDTQDVLSTQLSTASTNIPCNTTATPSGLISRDFVKPELNNAPTNPFSPNVNPLSWVLYAEKVQTQKTLPTVTPSADVDDCCKNCAYGPISFDGQKDASNNFILNGCRHVYQLPPINSLDPTNFTNTNRRAAFSFMKDFVVGAALNVNDIALQPSQSSKVKIRFTLPAYVELHSSLKSKIVKMKQTDAAIQSFCTTSHTPNTANASVFNALQNFIGVNLSSAFNSNFYSEITNTSDLIYLSSSSFYYEENRFDSLDQDGVPREKGMLSKLRDAGNTNIPSALPSGDTGSSDVLNQRPLIYWSIAGWPSEKHTHYIVVEIELDKNETCLTYLDMSQLKFNNQSSNHNLTKLIKGISFYPLHFTTSFLQGKFANSAGALLTNDFIHPAFLSYIIPDGVQNMPDFGFRNGASPNANTKYKPGFIDYGQGTSPLLPTSDLPGVIGNPLTWSFGENSTTGRASLSQIRYSYFIIKNTTDTVASSICFSQNYALSSRFSYQQFINKFYANAFDLTLP